MPHSSAIPQKDKTISIESVFMEFAKEIKHSAFDRPTAFIKHGLGIDDEPINGPKSISQLVRATSVSVTIGSGKVDVVTPSVRRTPSAKVNPSSSRHRGGILGGLTTVSSGLAASSFHGEKKNNKVNPPSQVTRGNLHPPADVFKSSPTPSRVSSTAPTRTSTPAPVDPPQPTVISEEPSSFQEILPSDPPHITEPDPSSDGPSADNSHPTTSLPADFDPTIPALCFIRDEHVCDLTGQVQKLKQHAVFQGSYSTVWKGYLNGDENQLVAMKVLRDFKVEQIQAHRRLRREVGTWWCLRHENIAPLLGLAKEGDFGAFGAIVSPWYENGTADEYLKKHGDTLSTLQKINLFLGVANGIQYLHTFTRAKGPNSTEGIYDGDITLVHGDLKPRNVLIDNQGVAKICDFGLLRLIRTGKTIDMSTSTNYTGTTRYLSYEMVAEDSKPETGPLRPTTASDIHALACVGMEFIYSRRPYAEIDIAHARTDYWITRAIEDKKPPSIRPLDCRGAVSELWDLFEQCWSLEPIERPKAEVVCSFLRRNRQELAKYTPSDSRWSKVIY